MGILVLYLGMMMSEWRLLMVTCPDGHCPSDWLESADAAKTHLPQIWQHIYIVVNVVPFIRGSRRE